MKTQYFIVMPQPFGKINLMCVDTLPPARWSPKGERIPWDFIAMPDGDPQSPEFQHLLAVQKDILQMYFMNAWHREGWKALPAPGSRQP